MTLATRVRLVVLLLAILAGVVVGFFIWRNRTSPTPSAVVVQPSPTPEMSPSPSPSSIATQSPSPDVPQAEPGLTTSAQPPIAGETDSFVGTLNLIVPVAGVRRDQLLDTYTDARSEGRSHDAIDIPAAAGTAVLAAADGQVVKLFQSERGGTTIYQLSADKKLVYYYAHLQRYADGIVEGKFLRQGEVIAYVGDTGNAGAGNYHLHFSIAVLSDPKRYWDGTNINPYPLLRK